MKLAAYRKLVAAGVGLALIYLKDVTGIEFAGASDGLVDAIMSLGTMAAVYWFRNDQEST